MTAASLQLPASSKTSCLLEAGSWKLEAPSDSSLHTACVFVVGKNYRLQDIQLSKSAFEAISCQPSAASRGAPRSGELLSKPSGICRERLRSTLNRAFHLTTRRAFAQARPSKNSFSRPAVLRSTRQVAGHPSLVRGPQPAYLRAKRFGGHPSPGFMSEGWRIPGSNR
jgi:hypothetical protein